MEPLQAGVYENGVFRQGDVRIADLSGRKKLPLGMSNFLAVMDTAVFVDKSMLVADVVDGAGQVKLFCRPRRFGKSLNLDMLQRFFEIPSPSDPNARDTTDLFRGLGIWDAEEGRYRSFHGAFPVIRFSFGNAKDADWETSLQVIRVNVAMEYERHRYVLDGEALSPDERALFGRITGRTANDGELASSLLFLTRVLNKHHRKPVIVLVDEYDAPVMAGYTHGYYAEVVGFLKGWLTGALKDNAALGYGVLTGVQRISKESVFSDLNNLTVNTPLSVASDERYGFTQAEVDALAAYRNESAAVPEARRWYDGYRFGSIDVFNPWSALSYFENGCTADIYWGNTSGNSVLGDMVACADGTALQHMYQLLEPGGTVEEALDTTVVFPDIGMREEALWAMLYLAGYLTTDDTALPNDISRLRPLRIPNLEVSELFRTQIVDRFASVVGSRDRLRRLHRAFVDGDAEIVQGELASILLNSASYYDLTREESYHALVLGLLFGISAYGDPLSNRESGRGRFDIRVAPLNPERHPLVVVELKHGPSGSTEADLSRLAAAALEQITSRGYDADGGTFPAGVVRWGLAFSGKEVAVASERIASVER